MTDGARWTSSPIAHWAKTICNTDGVLTNVAVPAAFLKTAYPPGIRNVT